MNENSSVTSGNQTRSSGTRLQFQHSEGRDRRTSECETTLVYAMSSRTARANRKTLSLEEKVNFGLMNSAYFLSSGARG